MGIVRQGGVSGKRPGCGILPLLSAQPSKQLAKRHAQLHPCQIGPQTEMVPDSKRDMIGLAIDSHLVGTIEDVFVVIARRIEHQHLLSRLDRVPAENGVGSDRSREAMNGRDDTQEFFDRIGNPLRSLDQAISNIGIPSQEFHTAQ